MPGSKAALNLIIILIFVGLVGVVLPSEYRVERSIEIEAPASVIYPMVVDLKKWQQWSSWGRLDPVAIYSYDGPDRAIGMRVQWQSDVLGIGSIQIDSLQFNRMLTYSLHNVTHGIEATGEIRLDASNNGIRVTWSSQGDVGLNIIDRYKLLTFDDKLGRDMEVGLENIKVLAENGLVSS